MLAVPEHVLAARQQWQPFLIIALRISMEMGMTLHATVARMD